MKLSIGKPGRQRRNTKPLMTGFALKLLLVTIVLTGLPGQLFSQSKASLKKTADAEFKRAGRFYSSGNQSDYRSALDVYKNARSLYVRAGSKRDEADTLLMIGDVYWQLRDPQSTFTTLESAVRIYGQINDDYGKASALNNIASYKRDIGALRESMQLYKEALPLMKKSRNNKGEAQVLNGIGEIQRYNGEIPEAIQNLRQSVTIWRTLELNDDKIRALRNLSLAYYASGDLAESVRYANDSLIFAKKRDNPALEVDVLESLAQIYDEDGKKEVAVDYRLKALNVYKQAAGRVSESAFDLVSNNLADIYYRMGKLETAYKIAADRIRPGANGRDYPTQTYLHGTICEILAAQGNPNEAIEACNRSIGLAREAADKHSEAYSLASLGIAFIGSNDLAKSENAFDRALQLVSPGENKSAEGKALAGLIFVYAQTGRRDMTLKAIQKAESTKLDTGSDVPAIQVLRAIGLANTLMGQHNQALSYLEKAKSLAKKRGNTLEQVMLLGTLGFANLQAGRFDEAINYYQASAIAANAFGNQRIEANSYSQLGWASLYAKKYDDALASIEKAVGVGQNVSDQRFKTYLAINVFHIAGKAHFGKGEYEESLAAIKQALSFAEKSNDKQGEKHFLTDMAEIYQAMGDSKQSKEYRKKAEKIR